MRRCHASVVSKLAALAAFTALGAGACAPAPPPAAPPPRVEAPVAPVAAANGPTATVWPTYAAFDFPLPRAAVWHWRLPQTPLGAREYAWLVAIPDSAGRPGADAATPANGAAASGDTLTRDALTVPVRFEFGFSLFQPAAVASDPAEGGFHALLTDGESGLWEHTADGVRRVPRVGVLAVPQVLRTGEAGTVSIQLHDPVLVAQLFGSRPEEVIAIEQLPGQPLRARRIAVRYR